MHLLSPACAQHTARAGGLCTRALLTLLALAADNALVPSLYNGSTLWATAVFALLVFLGRNPSAEEGEADDLPRLSADRLLAFCSLHAALLLTAHSFARTLATAAQTYSMGATLVASAKLAVLFPTLVLFPRNTWRPTWRRFRPELLAAVVVLFSFFPYRMFALTWPRYSMVLGHLVYLGARPFMGDLEYLPGPNPMVAGPLLDVRMVFDCSGLASIYLFDYLFGAVMLMEWRRLNKRRALASYTLGLVTMMLANVLRIILLILWGNLISPSVAVGKLHVHAGWIFDAIVFLVFLQLTFGWMCASPKGRPLPQRRDSGAMLEGVAPGSLYGGSE